MSKLEAWIDIIKNWTETISTNETVGEYKPNLQKAETVKVLDEVTTEVQELREELDNSSDIYDTSEKIAKKANEIAKKAIPAAQKKAKEAWEESKWLFDWLFSWWDFFWWIWTAISTFLWKEFPWLAWIFGLDNPLEEAKEKVEEVKDTITKKAEKTKEKAKNVQEAIDSASVKPKITAFFQFYRTSNELTWSPEVNKAIDSELEWALFNEMIEILKYKKYSDLKINKKSIISNIFDSLKHTNDSNLANILSKHKNNPQYEKLIKFHILANINIFTGWELKWKEQKLWKKSMDFIIKGIAKKEGVTVWEAEEKTLEEIVKKWSFFNAIKWFSNPAAVLADWNILDDLTNNWIHWFLSIESLSDLKDSDFNKISNMLPSELSDKETFSQTSLEFLKIPDNHKINISNWKLNYQDNIPKPNEISQSFIENTLLNYWKELYKSISNSWLDPQGKLKKDIPITTLYKLFLSTRGEANVTNLNSMEKSMLYVSINVIDADAEDLWTFIWKFWVKMVNQEWPEEIKEFMWVLWTYILKWAWKTLWTGLKMWISAWKELMKDPKSAVLIAWSAFMIAKMNLFNKKTSLSKIFSKFFI